MDIHKILSIILLLTCRVLLTGMRISNTVIWIYVWTHIILDADGAVVIYPEQNNTLLCPGESLHYSCHISRYNSITWSVQCPGASPRRFSLSSAHSEENRSENCNDIFHLDIHSIYKSTQSRTYSNITINVPYLNYSVAKARQSVKIGCGEGESEESIIYY